MRLCASKLTASSFLQLQGLVKMVKLPEEEDHQPLKKGEETPLQKGESLKKDEDAVSLDSSGHQRNKKRSIQKPALLPMPNHL